MSVFISSFLPSKVEMWKLSENHAQLFVCNKYSFYYEYRLYHMQIPRLIVEPV